MKKIWLVALALIFTNGCASFSSYDVQVSPSKEILKSYGNFPSIEVDVAGVSNEEATQLASYPIEKYFSPGNALRRHLNPVTLHFSDQDWQPKQLRAILRPIKAGKSAVLLILLLLLICHLQIRMQRP